METKIPQAVTQKRTNNREYLARTHTHTLNSIRNLKSC